jgi:hypothetical protein
MLQGMEGLAAGMAQQAPARDINEIVAMLQQGVRPEELLQMGVPEELIMAAMEMLTQEATAIPPEQEGLAGMTLQG